MEERMSLEGDEIVMKGTAVAHFISLMIVLSLVIEGVSVLGSDEGFSDLNSESSPTLKTVDDVWPVAIGMPDSKKAVYWYGDEVFFAVSRNETPGEFTSFLYHSPDGGETWEDPVEVTNWTGTLMRVELLISGDTLFYLVFRCKEYRAADDFETRSLHCYVLPVHDWSNISEYAPQRIDDTIPGFMSTYQLLEHDGDVFIFWVRGHYMDALYRRYSSSVWGEIISMDTGTYIGGLSALSSNISGEWAIELVYHYFVTGSLYHTSSSDGTNWSTPNLIWGHQDSFERISMTQWNGGLHLVVSEYSGYDIYHSFCSDGSSWSSFEKIGENTLNDLKEMDPRTNTVSITGNEDIDSLLVAYDTNGGVELLRSKDNGRSFSLHSRFRNGSAYYPSFCSEGLFVMYADDSHTLTLRRIGANSSNEPPGGDNETDPPSTPDDNSTVPPPLDDNSTHTTEPNGTSDGQDENGTDDQDDAQGMDGNGTGEGPPSSGNTPPERPRMVFMEGDMFEGKEIFIQGTGHDPDDNDTLLNYTWYVEGIGVVGYGPYLRFELPAGKYNMTLRVTDPQGAYSETTVILDIKGDDSRTSLGNAREDWGVWTLISVVLVTLLLMTMGTFILRKLKRKHEGEGPRPLRSPDTQVNRSMAVTSADVVQKEKGLRDVKYDLIDGNMSPAYYDPHDGVRRGMIVEEAFSGRRGLESSELLTEIRSAVETKGLRDQRAIDLIRDRADSRKEHGEMSQKVYQEIVGILDGHQG